MKVLWLCNIVIPKLCDLFGFNSPVVGGWIESTWNELVKHSDLSMGICVPIIDQNNLKDGVFNEGRYYSFLANKNTVDQPDKIVNRFESIINDFKPDIIHIWGTEYFHTYAMVSACNKAGLKDRIIINIQGLISAYSLKYGIGLESVEGDLAQNIENEKKEMQRRAIYEKKSLMNIKYVVGRTDWDRAYSRLINPSLEYFKCGEILRKGFYENAGKWNRDTADENRIFISQASYPIKGFHLMFDVFERLQLRYNKLKVIVGGDFRPEENTYHNFLKSEIKKRRLDGSVLFVGKLSESEMVEQYIKATVFLVPSLIENSSNSLCEAMMIGTPVVCSYTGGSISILQHFDTGFLFPVTEPYMAGFYLDYIFDKRNDQDVRLISNKESIVAKSICDKPTIIKNIKHMYEKVANSN